MILSAFSSKRADTADNMYVTGGGYVLQSDLTVDTEITFHIIFMLQNCHKKY